MMKKISILVIVITIVVGIGAILYKSSLTEDLDVLGENTKGIEIVDQTTKPKETFDQQTLPTNSPGVTNTPVPIVSQKEKGTNTMEIDTKKSYEAIFKTSVGDITVALTASATPITVNNFVTLAKKNFYANTIFHRVIKGFMIQGGDPKGNGTGGPGYTFNDEPFQGEYTRGTIAMANAGPNTNGSQFFIMHKDYALPKNYVIFGKVTKGIEVVDKIAEAPTQSSGEGSTPVNPVTVTAIEIVEK